VPVGGTQLFGLQGVEHAQHFFRVQSHVNTRLQIIRGTDSN
jgi:hypothetical protein